MSAFTYKKADPAEWDDLLDLANYVFSNAHEPHDFAALLPKVYGPNAPFDAAEQFIARRDDGRLRGLVALRHLDMTAGEDHLHVGFVGTVSVHPYARGEGHMKNLMRVMKEAACAQQTDILVLGGQRQRYQYFGFEKGGYRYRFTISSTNIRHALRDVDASGIEFADMDGCTEAQLALACALNERKAVRFNRPAAQFVDILRSWHSNASIVLDGGEMIGFAAGDGMEITLQDDAQLLRVIKAMMTQRGLSRMTIDVQPWEHDRIALLSTLAEDWSLFSPDMVQVLNWAHTLDVLLRLRSRITPLLDGACVLEIDGERLRLCVEDGKPSVSHTDAPADLTLTAMDAHQLLFALQHATTLHPLMKNWLPLPFDVPATDGF